MNCYEKACELTSKLTLREKIGQIAQNINGYSCYNKTNNGIEFTDEFKNKVKKYGGIGAISGLLRSDPWTKRGYGSGIELHERVSAANKLQKHLIENTRMGIPALIEVEASHGMQALGSTMYPTGLAISNSFNPKLYQKMMNAIGEEIKISGNHIAFVTLIDVLRDPRWGRSEECLGEDPYLAAKLAGAAVRGIKSSGTLVCAKHFLAAGSCVGGHNSCDIPIGERELREIHMETARSVVNSGADLIMAAYNSIDGAPCHCNKYLLKDILRNELGFKGIIISDGGGINATCEQLNISPYDGTTLCANAGIELSLYDLEHFSMLEDAVNKGDISESTINSACTSVLAKKYELGLFDNPYIYEDKVTSFISSGVSQKLAYEMAAESIVLLKNDNKILPLDKSSKICVIGQNAKNIYYMLGDYTSERAPHEGCDIYTAMKRVFNDALYTEGWNFNKDIDTESAINSAKAADTIILCMGGSSVRDFDAVYKNNGAVEYSKNFMDCGEGCDVASLELPISQTKLLKALKKTGKPIIAVLIQGRPYSIKEVKQYADAVICAWYPGQEGGKALVDIISGYVNPSGKLSVSIPSSADCLPVCYNSIDKSMPYVNADETVLYPFGYGLSYSEFEYNNVKISKNGTSKFEISVDISNTSDRDGSEIAMVFVQKKGGLVRNRCKELKAFKKLFIKAHSTTTVNFELDDDSFKSWICQNKYETVCNKADILIGGNPYKMLTKSISI